MKRHPSRRQALLFHFVVSYTRPDDASERRESREVVPAECVTEQEEAMDVLGDFKRNYISNASGKTVLSLRGLAGSNGQGITLKGLGFAADPST